MKLGVLKEAKDQRVAIIPDTIPKLSQLGIDVLIEKGAGESAGFNDDSYTEHAQVADKATVLKDADVIISIDPPATDLDNISTNQWLISQFQPFNDASIIEQLSKAKVNAFSLDMIPRTTLAQSMDILSSMASIAGYKAVLESARLLPRYFPMMITAAGSIKPSKILVLGAGVAGLQAIATARRLGAMVEAFDTRSAAKEEVLSLGAKFVEVEGATDDTGAGGYAVEQSEDFLKRQRAEVQARAIKADVIITTAQVRGRKAPLLVPASTVEQMKPGSVIIDLASSTGGNCELSKDNEIVVHNGVTIYGNSNLAELMPQDASTLYSNNLYNFLKHITKEGQLDIRMDDEIIAGARITPSYKAE
ncbi:MAG: Re/Si-specific NAD(P)(+) transhydrogenase subunit alpha [Bacteroidota bacterium]